MADVSCPSCGARLVRGALRCRHCGSDARAASDPAAAAARSRRPVTAPSPSRGSAVAPRRSPEEIVTASRDLFLGP